MACDVCLGINSYKCPVCGDYPESDNEATYLILHIGSRDVYRVSEDRWNECPDDEDMCSSAQPFCQIPLDEAYFHQYVDCRD